MVPVSMEKTRGSKEREEINAADGGSCALESSPLKGEKKGLRVSTSGSLWNRRKDLRAREC